ncbi:MAG: 3-hydroxybutyryl-CoA dehydrogenase [Alphaproteobacteria bacterium]|jgi:3-hydroxybutyryl-CoA dehydrogenase|nr:3-hydroxybutyryl-CoA dehydrogenase [Alphaproteobacteria bacterium]MBT4711096.1 3-hydroxybutyryl-CoA dehydrogenase [Alphaproteobacteria bacterium]
MTDAINSIGVIGAGHIGDGVARVCAVAGYDVVVQDTDPDTLAGAMGKIEAGLGRQAKSARISADEAKGALSRVRVTGNLADMADCDLVIESAPEDEEIKRQIYEDLKSVLKPHALIATNTSSISITRLATASDRPGKFIGMHFMNPVTAMALVEVIPGVATEQATTDAIMGVVERLGKTAVMAQDFPGFMVNRILAPMLNEAIYALHEGVGTVEAIDSALVLGAHHPMGPLALADFIGLDICLANMTVLYEGLADQKYRPCPLLVKYVEAGWLGRKSGRGFYDYSTEPPTPNR